MKILRAGTYSFIIRSVNAFKISKCIYLPVADGENNLINSEHRLNSVDKRKRPLPYNGRTMCQNSLSLWCLLAESQYRNNRVAFICLNEHVGVIPKTRQQANWVLSLTPPLPLVGNNCLVADILAVGDSCYAYRHNEHIQTHV